ncbi:MAG: hypothetical protein BGO12_08400 [Verrucomicrobia bacterium 61-8]|nr:MAG: hypothetical protein BGO12_08400 [Verrucomicrobia bacterium 61-8]
MIDTIQRSAHIDLNNTSGERVSELLRDKEVERYFAHNDALREFTMLFQEEKNQRAAVIVGVAYLDLLLENILVNFFADDEKEVEALLKNDRPLGTYGSRISLAYCLGLFGKIIRDDLRLVGRIRNRFAHDFRASFEEERIKNWCLSLRWHEISMMMSPPEGATPSEIFQVGVNQLVSHLNGVVGIARNEKRSLQVHS